MTKNFKKADEAVKTVMSMMEVIKQLETYPIVQVACEKAGVGRSTYYKWRSQNKEFAKAADEAIRDGNSFISDLAESKLIRNIQNGNNTAIIFWLKNHHKKYGDRIIHEHEYIPPVIDPVEAAKISAKLREIGKKTLTEFGESLRRDEEKKLREKEKRTDNE